MSAGSLFLGGRYRSELDDGTPNAGGQLWPTASGTTTFQQTFVDAALTTPNTFESDGFGGIFLVLDARGEAEIWLGPEPYRFTEKTAAGVTISTTDGVQSVAGYVATAISVAIAGIPSPDTIPPGVIADYAGAGVPAGWLACNGAEVSRTAYAALFAAIGTTWGAGNGSTTFTLPDCRGRVLVGAGGAVTAELGNTVGSIGGSMTHVLTPDEVGPHTHPVIDPGHAHGDGESKFKNLIDGTVSAYVRKDGDPINNQTTISTTGITVGDNTGGAPFSILQPAAVVTMMIKV